MPPLPPSSATSSPRPTSTPRPCTALSAHLPEFMVPSTVVLPALPPRPTVGRREGASRLPTSVRPPARIRASSFVRDPPRRALPTSAKVMRRHPRQLLRARWPPPRHSARTVRSAFQRRAPHPRPLRGSFHLSPRDLSTRHGGEVGPPAPRPARVARSEEMPLLRAAAPLVPRPTPARRRRSTTSPPRAHRRGPLDSDARSRVRCSSSSTAMSPARRSHSVAMVLPSESIHDQIDWALSHVDLTYPEVSRLTGLISAASSKAAASIQLTPRLARCATLVRISPQRHFLLLNITIVSGRLVLRHLRTRGRSPSRALRSWPPVATARATLYADFASWQRSWLRATMSPSRSTGGASTSPVRRTRCAHRQYVPRPVLAARHSRCTWAPTSPGPSRALPPWVLLHVDSVLLQRPPGPDAPVRTTSSSPIANRQQADLEEESSAAVVAPLRSAPSPRGSPSVSCSRRCVEPPSPLRASGRPVQEKSAQHRNVTSAVRRSSKPHPAFPVRPPSTNTASGTSTVLRLGVDSRAAKFDTSRSSWWIRATTSTGSSVRTKPPRAPPRPSGWRSTSIPCSPPPSSRANRSATTHWQRRAEPTVDLRTTRRVTATASHAEKVTMPTPHRSHRRGGATCTANGTAANSLRTGPPADARIIDAIASQAITCLESADMTVADNPQRHSRPGRRISRRPQLPHAERLAFMLEDSVAPVIYSPHTSLQRASVPSSPGAVPLRDEGRVLRVPIPAGPAVAVSPEIPAYVIHVRFDGQSPRSVALPHRALSHLLAWQLRQPARRPPRSVRRCPSTSCQELFSTWWAGGGTLVLPTGGLRQDIRPCSTSCGASGQASLPALRRAPGHLRCRRSQRDAALALRRGRHRG